VNTVAAQLANARKALVAADIAGSALDARLLLQAASGLSHEDLVAGPDLELSADAVILFQKHLKRRLAHEPISRILGTREFYGREFLVTPAVLDPRADTEALIELVLELLKPEHRQILDLGTGSGAIAVSLVAERQQLSGTAVDLSAAALDVAKQNARINSVAERMTFHQGSWFSGLSGVYDVIASNPPYIGHSDIAGLGEEVRNYDPHLALDGGVDGLQAYRAIAADTSSFLKQAGFVAVEIGAGQKDDVVHIFVSHGLVLLGQRLDLGGHIRALAFGRLD
jgi:release factor glutamine methyltransferase